jgi:hypothetical protein
MAVQARRMWWGARRRWVSTSAGPERVVELVAETVPLAGWWGTDSWWGVVPWEHFH